MKRIFRQVPLAALLTLSLLCADPSAAIPLDQYATTVLGFSSQWSSGAWSANQALGAPDTFAYGDISSAWAPRPRDGTLEFITVGFDTPVFASGATIRETYGSGFVYQIDALSLTDDLNPVWTGTDPSAPGSPVDFDVQWAPTDYLVAGLKIYTDTDHDPAAWEEIDSIQLHGSTEYSVIAEPATFLLMATGLVGLASYRRKRKQRPA
jgi:hypothetical protein